MALAELGNGDEAVELFHMLNPINHTRDAADVERYKVEPYVLAGDVYAHPQHMGRGGWTWYTGSAGWLYRAGLEIILGLTRRGDDLHARAVRSRGVVALHASTGASVQARTTSASTLRASVRPSKPPRWTAPQSTHRHPLVDDGAIHEVAVPTPAIRDQSGRRARASAPRRASGAGRWRRHRAPSAVTVGGRGPRSWMARRPSDVKVGRRLQRSPMRASTGIRRAR